MRKAFPLTVVEIVLKDFHSSPLLARLAVPDLPLLLLLVALDTGKVVCCVQAGPPLAKQPLPDGTRKFKFLAGNLRGKLKYVFVVAFNKAENLVVFASEACKNNKILCRLRCCCKNVFCLIVPRRIWILT